MLRSPFRLNKTIGRSYSVDPDDTLRTKMMLKGLGYFETPSYGVTPYPDGPLFAGIEQFQDDFDLHRDGVMEPHGETIKKLNEVLKHKHRIPITDAQRAEGPHSSGSPADQPSQKAPSNDRKEREPDGEQTALAPAVPVIVYEIAALFSMTVAAAYA